jgi:hypothetical protein
MSYPLADLSSVTVVGTYRDTVSGRPARGKVKFTPQAFVVSEDGGTLLVPTPFEVKLDTRGWVEFTLPVANDPDYTPAFSYLVEEKLTPTRLQRPPFVIAPTVADEPFDLTHAVPTS